MSDKKTLDVVAFGATGFTGRQVALYLAAHPDRARFRFGIAGRSQDKLAALAQELESNGHSVDATIVADGLDGEALDQLAAQTRVVLSTAGPFAKFGSELVRACVEQQTHYVDITGETPWVRAMIDQHHEQALADKTRIIPCCGYDSIPSDLGTLFAADALQRGEGVQCQRARAFHRGKGGLNGGTVASMINMQREGAMPLLKDPFLLNPKGSRPTSVRDHRDPVAPFYSRQAGAWAAPFFMGPINTRVVRRSHALLAGESDSSPFAADFSYQEYWKASGPLGLAEASTLATMQAATSAMTWIPGATSLLERVAVDPGEGPSDETMDNGFFATRVFAEGGVDSGQAKLVEARLGGAGDPGNRITVKCVCESALLLALDETQLPQELAGGVLTPASGLGLALVPRLEAAGIHFEVVPDDTDA